MKKLAIILIFLAWPALAWGYIPPVAELLTGITAKRVRLMALKAVYEFPMPLEARSSISRPDDEDWDPEIEETADPYLVRETVFYRTPDRIRLNLSWPDREEVFLAVNRKALVMVGDKAVRTPWPQPFLVYRLLIESEASRLRLLLEAFGFRLKRVTLGRHGDRIVYILGARSGDLTKPQVWFDRQTLRLTRLILPPRGGRPGYDVTLDQYRAHRLRVDWPARLVTRINNGPPVEIKLKSLAINPKIEEAAFGHNEMKQPGAPAQGKTSPNPELTKIRKMMERLRKKLE